MYLMISKYIFVSISILLTILFSLRTFLPNLFKDSKKNSPFMALLAGLFITYILSGLFLCALIPTLKYKLIMLIFTLSPFIIGKLVTYKKLKFYSIFQIFCVILSMVFIILI